MKQATWLDKAIGWVSPAAGAKRIAARAAMGTMRRAYEGGSAGRRTDGWVSTGTDANAEIYGSQSRLRSRSRDLVRNNPYANRAMNALVANIVGPGIVPKSRVDVRGRSKTEDRRLKRLDDLWWEWTRVADSTGRTDFYGLEALAVRTMAESGSVLIRRRRRFQSDGLPVAFQLQIMEPDYLDSSKDLQKTPAGGYIRNGVEYDVIGRRVAYWIFREHPGAQRAFISSSPFESVRVPAEEIIHLFEPLRPGQETGVPWLAPAIIKLRDLDEYDEAELVRKKIEACFAAFVTGDEDGQTAGAAETVDGKRIETFEPGMVEYLPAGKSITFGEPKATGGYTDFMRVQLHAIASALGLTYELLTGDLSQVNFSSARMGLLEFRRRVTQVQRQVVIPQFCEPVFRWFVEAAVAGGQIPQADYWAEWSLPRFDAVQPLQDAMEELLRIRSGTLTFEEACAQRGLDAKEVLSSIAATNDLMDSLGIILDSDPRKVTKAGGFQTSTDAASEDPEEQRLLRTAGQLMNGHTVRTIQ